MTVPRNSPIAVSLAPPTTFECLHELEELPAEVGMAEIRLDLMRAFDIQQLVKESPLPLVMTCRTKREGGHYDGSERDRLAILRTAYDCGCAFIDVEADSLDIVSGWPASPTRVIGSRHWYDRMPENLREVYEDLRSRCDVVKLSAMASSATDVLPIFEFLRNATTSVIGIAMGNPGACTRILSPIFPHTLLTYGSMGAGTETAPGQITVGEMVDTYSLQLVDAGTRAVVHVVHTDAQQRTVTAAQARVTGGRELHVSLRTADSGDAARLAAAFKQTLPDVEVEVADVIGKSG